MAYLVKKCNDFDIDGNISAKEWETAEEWAFSRLGERDAKLGDSLNEIGSVKMLHSDKYWYIAVDMEDSDVVAQGTEDQQHHYNMGDTIEVFLKLADDTYYWEMYGTPNELRTTFSTPHVPIFLFPAAPNTFPTLKSKQVLTAK